MDIIATRHDDFIAPIEAARAAVLKEQREASNAPISQLKPSGKTAASSNELRPERWDDIVGQEKAKRLLARMVAASKARHRPLDHTLLVGASGTGKTTFANVIANELGTQVWQFEAPINSVALGELATVMQDGDILFLDEIHQQAAGDRRGRLGSTNPEILFSVMEDFTLPTPTGVIEFPKITVIGATTDPGQLPEAFLNRFPIRPRLESYTEGDMLEIAMRSARKAGVGISRMAGLTFARASRGVPREINSFIRNARMLTGSEPVRPPLAEEIVCELHGYSLDGLTGDMQGMLTFLYERGRRVNGKGEVIYQASVSTIATALGFSRDQKAVVLYVEPWLIQQGYVQVLNGGRALTPAGVTRAKELL
jgi:holliday junction DNA helicase RuvB